jgi:hypothetical protein
MDGLFQDLLEHPLLMPDTMLPNVVVEWLTLYLLIREVPGSNLGPEADYRN